MRPLQVYTVEGIILKKRSVGEADRLLTVFTKQKGKIRVLAKGVRRITSRRAGHLEVFSRVMLTIHTHRSWELVSEAQALTRGALFELDVSGVGYAYCMCELVDQLLADRQEHEDVYMLLQQGLENMTRVRKMNEWREIMFSFVHKLLWILGFLAHDNYLDEDHIQPYIERITERRFRTWPLLTAYA